MTDGRLVEELVSGLLGWKVCPDRFVKPGRSWIPKWRFNPLASLEDAFLLLGRSGGVYVLSLGSDGVFTVEVKIEDRIGKASGEPKARSITLAISRALGIGEE